MKKKENGNNVTSNLLILVFFLAIIWLLYIELKTEPKKMDDGMDSLICSIQSFGAVGDGISDDSKALYNFAAFCKKNGSPFYIPQNVKIYTPELVIISGLKTIKIMGTIVAPNGIEFRGYSSQTGYNWFFNNVEGTLRLSGIKNGIVTLQNAEELVLSADSKNPDISSIAYNQFHFGYVRSVILEGIANGWINENFFYGGRIRKLLFADGGQYPHNHNHFYNNTFEDGQIEFFCGRSNYIHNARFEGDIKIIFHEKASNNYVHRSWVGEHVPGSMSIPKWWNDESGNNYYYYGVLSPVSIYEKVLTVDSYNYNANQVYPLNGRLHNKAYSNGLIETGLIKIDHAVGITIESDEKFFRGSVYLFDENRAQIETEPELSPVYGSTFRWKGDHYIFGESNQDRANFSLSKITILGGKDTGAFYAKIVINGYGEADFDYLRITITAPWYKVLEAFGENRLVASSAPANGEWAENTICYNIGTNGPIAWIYKDHNWRNAF